MRSVYQLAPTKDRDRCGDYAVGGHRELYEETVAPARQMGYASLAPYWERGVYDTNQIAAALAEDIEPDLLASILSG